METLGVTGLGLTIVVIAGLVFIATLTVLGVGFSNWLRRKWRTKS